LVVGFLGARLRDLGIVELVPRVRPCEQSVCWVFFLYCIAGHGALV